MSKVLIIVLLGVLGFGTANLVACAKKQVVTDCPACPSCPVCESVRRGG